MPAQGLGVRVETEKNGLVDERVFLLSPGAFLDFLASGSDNGLDFITVDQTSNIRIADLSSREAKGWYFLEKIPETEMYKDRTCNPSCGERLSQRFQRLRREGRKRLQSR